MDAILTAIMTKTVDSALATAVGGRIYFQEGPDGAAYPYIIFFPVSQVPEYPGGKTMEDMWWQFSIYSTSAGLTEITDILTKLRSLFDDCNLTISGETLIYCLRGNLAIVENIEMTTTIGTQMVRHWAQDYAITTVH